MNQFVLILHGSADSTPDGVSRLKEALAKKLQLSDGTVAALFERLPAVLRRANDRAELDKYSEALCGIGAIVEIREDSRTPAGQTSKAGSTRSSSVTQRPLTNPARTSAVSKAPANTAERSVARSSATLTLKGTSAESTTETKFGVSIDDLINLLDTEIQKTEAPLPEDPVFTAPIVSADDLSQPKSAPSAQAPTPLTAAEVIQSATEDATPSIPPRAETAKTSESEDESVEFLPSPDLAEADFSTSEKSKEHDIQVTAEPAIAATDTLSSNSSEVDATESESFDLLPTESAGAPHSLSFEDADEPIASMTGEATETVADATLSNSTNEPKVSLLFDFDDSAEPTIETATPQAAPSDAPILNLSFEGESSDDAVPKQGNRSESVSQPESPQSAKADSLQIHDDLASQLVEHLSETTAMSGSTGPSVSAPRTTEPPPIIASVSPPLDDDDDVLEPAEIGEVEPIPLAIDERKVFRPNLAREENRVRQYAPLLGVLAVVAVIGILNPYFFSKGSRSGSAVTITPETIDRLLAEQKKAVDRSHAASAAAQASSTQHLAHWEQQVQQDLLSITAEYLESPDHRGYFSMTIDGEAPPVPTPEALARGEKFKAWLRHFEIHNLKVSPAAGAPESANLLPFEAEGRSQAYLEDEKGSSRLLALVIVKGSVDLQNHLINVDWEISRNAQNGLATGVSRLADGNFAISLLGKLELAPAAGPVPPEVETTSPVKTSQKKSESSQGTAESKPIVADSAAKQ